MKRMSVMMVGLVVMLFGCSKTNFLPTGPSEAVASDTAKSSVGTGTSTTIVSFSPAQATVRVGDEITIDAVVGSVIDLYGIATTIVFDSSKLQFVRAEEERLIAAQNPTSFMSDNKSDPNELVIGLVSMWTGNVHGVTGYGTLFRVTFKAISSGQSELKFIRAALFNSINEGDSKQKINSEFRSATITIR